MTTTADTTRAVQLTDRELQILVDALQIMRSDFGHDEAVVLKEVQLLLDKVTSANKS